MKRVGVTIVFLALAAAFGHIQAARAAAPPSLMVEVIGKGKVTGSGISCGQGALTCYSAYGSAATVTLTEKPAPGWTFSGWEDGANSCPVATTCGATPASPATVATAVFSPPSGTVAASTFGVALASPANGTVTGGSPSQGDTIDCPTTPADCSITVLAGSTITVVATPDTGFFFGGWGGGSCSGTSAYCATYLDSNANVSATFVDSTTTYDLTVSVSGDGSVTGGGITCGPGQTCDAQEPPAANVTLTAEAAAGYAFTGWSGDCTGTQPSCTVQTNAARSVTATFGPLVPFSLTVGGSGTVSGGGVTCGPGPQTCSGQTAPSSTLTFTAAPAVAGGSVIWSGCSSFAGTVCTVNVNSDAVSVTATFSGGTSPPTTSTYALTLSVQGDGTVVSLSGNAAVHCTAAGGTGCIVNVQSNSSLTLSAVPASGTAGDFQSWTGACVGFTTTSCTLTMTGPKSVGVNFAGGNTTYVLSGTVSGDGTISGAGLSCTSAGGLSCQAQQAAGATVTLTAMPTAGGSFTGWSGACSGTTPTCQVSMTTAKSVTATFSGGGGGGTATSLELSVAGPGSVSAAGGVCSSTGRTKVCTQQYAQGQAVRLRAKAPAGSLFTGWSGACTGKKLTCEVTMTATLAVGAIFKPLALASAAKPKVVQHTVTLTYIAHEAGTATLTTKGPGTVRAKTAKVKAGRRTLKVAVPEAGRWTFTLTLKTKTGNHAIRWRVTVE